MSLWALGTGEGRVSAFMMDLGALNRGGERVARYMVSLGALGRREGRVMGCVTCSMGGHGAAEEGREG